MKYLIILVLVLTTKVSVSQKKYGNYFFSKKTSVTACFGTNTETSFKPSFFAGGELSIYSFVGLYSTNFPSNIGSYMNFTIGNNTLNRQKSITSIGGGYVIFTNKFIRLTPYVQKTFIYDIMINNVQPITHWTKLNSSYVSYGLMLNIDYKMVTLSLKGDNKYNFSIGLGIVSSL